MAGGNRSAAAKKAWVTRRAGGALRAKAKAYLGMTATPMNTFRGKMTAKQWTKKMSAGEVMLNGRPMRDFFTTRGTRRK